jgi:ubiquinone/menaquinone biosynthesis C-methylase UbiE
MQFNKKLYFIGMIYDKLLERLLSPLKRRIASYVHIYKSMPVLDLCCGTGAQGDFLRENRLYFGIDLDKKMLHYAAGKRHFHFAIADAMAIPFRNCAFGTIIISFSLHDKTALQRRQILSEACRLLRYNGILIILDFEQPWNSQSLRGSYFANAIEHLASKSHYINGQQFIKNGGLKKLLSEYNLREITDFQVKAGSCRIVVTRFLHRSRA